MLQIWKSRSKFTNHLVAFLLIIIPSALLYPAANHGATGWILFLLALVVAGNILAVLPR